MNKTMALALALDWHVPLLTILDGRGVRGYFARIVWQVLGAGRWSLGQKRDGVKFYVMSSDGERNSTGSHH